MENVKDNFCCNCKYFCRHYTIAVDRLSLLKTQIGTCKMKFETNKEYPNSNDRSCKYFEPYIENYDENLLKTLEQTAFNLNVLTWIIKENKDKIKPKK